MNLFVQRLAKKIILRYSQRWILMFDKKKLSFTSQVSARHLSTGKCFCQFIEDQFCSINNKHTKEFTSKQQTSKTHFRQRSPPIVSVNSDGTTTDWRKEDTNNRQLSSPVSTDNTGSCNILIENGGTTTTTMNTNVYKKQENGLLNRISRPPVGQELA